MRRSTSRRPLLLRPVRRVAVTGMVVVLALPLVGCLSNEIIPAAIDLPKAYRSGPRSADAALPSVGGGRVSRPRAHPIGGGKPRRYISGGGAGGARSARGGGRPPPGGGAL